LQSRPSIFAPLGDCPWTLHPLAQLMVTGRL